MKKCDQFKDMILTDFIDGQLDKKAAKEVEDHLLDCASCRAFFKEVKENAAIPFQQVSRQAVPEGLWSAIRENIEQEQQQKNPLADVFEHLKGLLIFPRMVPVFASLMLMLLVGSVTLNNIQIQQVKDRDQGEFLVAMLSPTNGSTASEGGDLGTPIEHYFL